MKLIVGLGNPGKEYEYTRHNVGFIVVDNYMQNLSFKEEKDYLICKTVIGKENVIFLKPLTFMNNSGKAVKKVADYYKIPSEDILVIRDDLDLPKSYFRLKFSSSSSGHNGIKSIISALNTQDFLQLKIGIGKYEKIPVVNYVLGKLSSEEIANLKDKKYSDIINSFIIDGTTKTMNNFHMKD